MAKIYRAVKTALHIRSEPRGIPHWYWYHHV